GDGRAALWSLWFSPGVGDVLSAGRTYTTPGVGSGGPTVQFFGSGLSCNVVGSQFTIREFAVASGSSAGHATIDYQIHCGSANSPAVTGTLRYGSTVDQLVFGTDRKTLSFASATLAGGGFGSGTSAQPLPVTRDGAANG